MAEPGENVLRQIHQDLVRQNDERGSESVLDFMVMLSAAEEAMSAMQRGDATAIEFHVAMMKEKLRTAALPEIRIADDT